MKKTLGLDIGTNSIGWAVVSSTLNDNDKEIVNGIISAGSRIIPMDGASLGKFNNGKLESQTALRTEFRGARRLRERRLLRRQRLLRVLSVMGFLPKHFSNSIDRYGKFLDDSEPKLAWVKDNDKDYRFLFMDSYYEMLEDFHKSHPSLMASGKKIPYDWTLYYLRKKALTQAISKEELAWILLCFNQKRGYYQFRDEQEEQDNKLKEYYALKVIDVKDTGQHKGKAIWYDVILENGWVYPRSSDVPLTDWIGQIKEFIVTTTLGTDGKPKKDKDGEIKRSFRMPKPEDWMLLKKKTEVDIANSGKQVGEYIYDTIKERPDLKIRGNWVSTIERKFYKEELTKILAVQSCYIPELKDTDLYSVCVDALYPNNAIRKRVLSDRDFTYLLRDDVLFYQRPLKSKKSLIADCPYEERTYKDKQTGELKRSGIKCISKSHPLFQEFRLWQFISNLRIYQREKEVDGKLKLDVDVTAQFLPDEDSYEKLFTWLNSLKQIGQDALLKYKPFALSKKGINNYRWNYVEDKIYPCNETRAQFLSYLKKAEISGSVLTPDFEMSLWHILYSVSDSGELHRALEHFSEKHSLGSKFVEVFDKIPAYERSYGSYSEKAIKKLLPLMRLGAYWKETNFDAQTRERINKILSGEYDETIRNRVREKALRFNELSDFRGLPLWLACYIVYDRHSEAKDVDKWRTPEDIDIYLKEFKQYSLRNPIVEQVILETLRTVRDIWKQEGYIDEIHVEMGREMKNPKDKRVKMMQQISENEVTNMRIKAMLLEFMNPDMGIEGVRPYSPMQQDILRIYEDTILKEVEELPDDIASILKKFNETEESKRPSHSDVLRYKLWLEQRYFSPYTGKLIPLSKLFTSAYEIEHVIPKKRYFDDSFSNKVICESAVNKLKADMLGYEFIQSKHGQLVDLGDGSSVRIFSKEEYEQFVKDNYAHNKKKMGNLLLEDIPEDFISRQLNDSRYISKFVKKLLSNIVRSEEEQEETSKNVITCTGNITDRLKKDWGINDVWNKIILPRFIRLNEMTGSHQYTCLNTSGHTIPAVPLQIQKGFNKKRIDHRHHAMDAIVIACASRDMVNYLNNSNASKEKGRYRYDLQHKLCSQKQIIDKPWPTITEDTYAVLDKMVVTFKQNLRVINKTVNKYEHFNSDGKKVLVKQTKGANWAIRKPLHGGTFSSEINLRRIKVVTLKEALKNIQAIVNKDLKRQLGLLVKMGADEKRIKKYFDENHEIWQEVNIKKIPVYYFTKETKERYFASRNVLDETFDNKKIREKIADTGIQKILLKHLSENGNLPKQAFSPEGILRMNQNIYRLNDNKPHQPIRKVRVFEKADKYTVGTQGNKRTKFVEAAKGTNLFFAVYETSEEDSKTGSIIKKRSYQTVPLYNVIERLKQGLTPAPVNEDGIEPLFVLSPNDLVYVPTSEEIKNQHINYPLDNKRIYKMVSATGNECHFIQEHVAKAIVDKYEFSPLNKMARAISSEMIKEVCIPVHFDRIGNLVDK